MPAAAELDSHVAISFDIMRANSGLVLGGV